MTKYRGKKQHRPAHPKIYVWSHTERAEIEYFQEFKQHLSSPLLMPDKITCWTPQELIEQVIKWKNKNICDEDGDRVWCIFDIDDFYKRDPKGFMGAIQNALDNNIKIAYINECFELWILLHFQNIQAPVERGKKIEKQIQDNFKKNKLGKFKKNQKVFQILLPFQQDALRNAKSTVKSYAKIKWEEKLNTKGNPSTSIHFLIEEIIENCRKK